MSHMRGAQNSNAVESSKSYNIATARIHQTLLMHYRWEILTSLSQDIMNVFEPVHLKVDISLVQVPG